MKRLITMAALIVAALVSPVWAGQPTPFVTVRPKVHAKCAPKHTCRPKTVVKIVEKVKVVEKVVKVPAPAPETAKVYYPPAPTVAPEATPSLRHRVGRLENRMDRHEAGHADGGQRSGKPKLVPVPENREAAPAPGTAPTPGTTPEGPQSTPGSRAKFRWRQDPANPYGVELAIFRPENQAGNQPHLQLIQNSGEGSYSPLRTPAEVTVYTRTKDGTPVTGVQFELEWADWKPDLIDSSTGEVYQKTFPIKDSSNSKGTLILTFETENLRSLRWAVKVTHAPEGYELKGKNPLPIEGDDVSFVFEKKGDGIGAWLSEKGGGIAQGVSSALGYVSENKLLVMFLVIIIVGSGGFLWWRKKHPATSRPPSRLSPVVLHFSERDYDEEPAHRVGGGRVPEAHRRSLAPVDEEDSAEVEAHDRIFTDRPLRETVLASPQDEKDGQQEDSYGDLDPGTTFGETPAEDTPSEPLTRRQLWVQEGVLSEELPAPAEEAEAEPEAVKAVEEDSAPETAAPVAPVLEEESLGQWTETFKTVSARTGPGFRSSASTPEADAGTAEATTEAAPAVTEAPAAEPRKGRGTGQPRTPRQPKTPPAAGDTKGTTEKATGSGSKPRTTRARGEAQKKKVADPPAADNTKGGDS